MSEAAATPQVVVYSTAFCGYCERAKALLTRKGVPYTEIRVDEDLAARQEMMARSKLRTVPQIFINERHIGGYDELSALDRAGQLEPLLQTRKP